MNGRPRFVINRDIVQEYRNAGLRWIDISKLMNISNRTLSRWRIQNNFEVLIAILYIRLLYTILYVHHM